MIYVIAVMGMIEPSLYSYSSHKSQQCPPNCFTTFIMKVKLEAVHLAQAINYLEAYNLEIGLLINFGNTKLEFHRLENKKYKIV